MSMFLLVPAHTLAELFIEGTGVIALPVSTPDLPDVGDLFRIKTDDEATVTSLAVRVEARSTTQPGSVTLRLRVMSAAVNPSRMDRAARSTLCAVIP